MTKGWDGLVNVCRACVALSRKPGAEYLLGEPRSRCFVCGYGHAEVCRVPAFEASAMKQPRHSGPTLYAQCHRCGTLWLDVLGKEFVCDCEAPRPVCPVQIMSRMERSR